MKSFLLTRFSKRGQSPFYKKGSDPCYLEWDVVVEIIRALLWRCIATATAAALLAATGNFEEIPMHVRACANTGASERDVMEAFQHVAIYAGVPKANHAIKLAKQVFSEMRG